MPAQLAAPLQQVVLVIEQGRVSEAEVDLSALWTDPRENALDFPHRHAIAEGFLRLWSRRAYQLADLRHDLLMFRQHLAVDKFIDVHGPIVASAFR